MIPHIESFVRARPGSWLIAALFAIASAVFAGDGRAAGGEEAQSGNPVQVRDYRPVFLECRRAEPGADDAAPPRLAIRRMEIDGTATLLTVDPASLATTLEREQDWSCADTDDDRQRDTRYIRAVHAAAAAQPGGTTSAAFIANGGLIRAATDQSSGGSFITGDLCPSNRPLDRAFLETLRALESPLPLAIAISGAWLTRHAADFRWLREQERAGAFAITWIDHSYSHPYVPGRPLADNFMLMQGIDMRAESLDTERLLIAKGVTPSVFFRFPGLISNPALMRLARDEHLIVLGADAWLARAPRARPGDIILVHLNGNEPEGLKIFSALLADGKLPRPFGPIAKAP